MTPGLLKASHKSERLFSKAIGKDKTSNDYKKYITYRNKYNSIKRKAKTTYYNNKINQFKQDSSKLWKLLKEVIGKQSNKSSISDTFTINNTPCCNPKTISNAFCNYFSSLRY